MRILKKPFSSSLLLILLSTFLLAAGFSRYLETDSGNILIHDIDVESWEGFLYGGRLFRPMQASSMNQRPAILLIPGNTGDRYTGDHVAMELARRGFVVLTMEDFSQGTTAPQNGFETENLVDSGYAFLISRSFTDHSRIGLIAYYEGTEKALAADCFNEFSSPVFVSPPAALMNEEIPDTLILAAKYETDAAYRLPEATVNTTHAGMIWNKDVLASLMEKFHEDLSIPDDSPFWFDARSQRAGWLLGLRSSLLILLMVICVIISTMITQRNWIYIWKIPAGIIIPLLVFTGISEFMNFFLISVRMGTPFGYLPKVAAIQNHFSLPFLLIFIAAALTGSLLLFRNRFYLSDCIAAIGILLCLIGVVPLFSGNTSGWEVLNLTGIRSYVILITALACLESLLLRITSKENPTRACCAVVISVMFYLTCSTLPFAVL